MCCGPMLDAVGVSKNELRIARKRAAKGDHVSLLSSNTTTIPRCWLIMMMHNQIKTTHNTKYMSMLTSRYEVCFVRECSTRVAKLSITVFELEMTPIPWAIFINQTVAK